MSSSVVIIGNGSLALGLSYYLREAGYFPRLISRDGAVETLGYRVKGPRGVWNVHLPPATPDQIQSAKLCFVAVKSFQLGVALTQHGPQLREGTCVIPIGNGAVDPILADAATRFSRLPWRLGVTTIAVSDEGRGKLSLKNESPQVVWGPLSQNFSARQEAETALIEKCPEIFTWRNDIAVVYRKKWLFNTVINSLCGVFRLSHNGLLLKHRQAVMRAFAEAYSLAESHWGPWPEVFTAENIFSELLELIEATFENENSMAKDVRLGRATETAQLAGLVRSYDGYPFLKELDDKLRQPTIPTQK